MKIIAINGSPRKGWNSDRPLLSWVDGIKSVCNDADIEVVNLYDLTFTGCRSCFACKLKDGKYIYSKYESEYFDEADKRHYRDTHFSLDLKAAFDAGAKCAEKLLKK